ncbi:hypothetical protein SAMN05216226_109125 [Halovenus aranensis]|uniref:Uncharacterized protein n=1 Tax=Halovenus aranensis TaxID=890420 RepID=A0A1G8WQK2_9EURY|nr:hypothetical protein [Halovenus aranensis]SDJ79905.1 hypothetical protein SAMN05216226_109125 [Halovenus aranensis]
MPMYDAEAKVSGRYVVPFAEAAGEVSPVFERKVRDTFEERIGELASDGWYQTEAVRDSYYAILERVGSQTMISGGEQTARGLSFDSGLSVFEAFERLNALQVSDEVYRDTTQDKPAGEYTFERRGERSGRLGVTNEYPYPQPFVKGIYTGIIKQWGPEDSIPTFEQIAEDTDERFAWKTEW